MLSSQHFLPMWAGLELNLLTFLALIKIRGQNKLEINSIKYFLAQALGSIILLLRFISMGLGQPRQAQLIFTMRILIKLGVFPFQA